MIVGQLSTTLSLTRIYGMQCRKEKQLIITNNTNKNITNNNTNNINNNKLNK